MRRGNDVESKELFFKAYSLDPNFVEPQNKLAYLYFQEGDFTNSVHWSSLVTKQLPVHFNALVGLAVTLEKQGHVGDAIERLQDALGVHPWFDHVPTLLQSHVHDTGIKDSISKQGMSTQEQKDVGSEASPTST
jgi:tetratricopeptide (TPR) repeat protein